MQVFNFVRDRIWKKLKGWNEKALSRAGRSVLIKSIAQAIPSFVMGLFLLPSTLCSQIEKMINNFYWGGNAETRKLNWIRWDRLATPKSIGGLGFRSFHNFNKAMLGKQWWWLMSRGDSFMARILKARYYPKCDLGEARKCTSSSFLWKSLYSARDMMNKGSLWKVGDGQRIQI
ncbi:uncharacterized mitochondrial protein AtMg00310-like [Lotus japonicus]|uniref:uncharacterized mitochondrial protein AtMg00310-like n=1 Tax=Lotus japonicus TaxID=34305 RepID=UPI002589641F|nr:uncharacterized mitochondrial protein AtMg00310-like [Lotus japonicus]